MDLFDFPVILLAAGQSRRMRGRDKMLEDAGGMPLLQAQALKARAATTAQVLVTLPEAPHPRYAALAGLDVTPVPVPDAGDGMSASLRRGIDALPRDCARVMVVLADLPDITTHDMKIVSQAVDIQPSYHVWRGATEDGKAGHPIIFDRKLFADLRALSGDGGAREMLAGHRVWLVPLPGDHARTDLDTPEDWAAWRSNRTPPSRT